MRKLITFGLAAIFGVAGCDNSKKYYLVNRADLPDSVERIDVWSKPVDSVKLFQAYIHSPARDYQGHAVKDKCQVGNYRALVSEKEMKELGFKTENRTVFRESE